MDNLLPLECRVLFAATPASPRADSLGTTFDKGERQDLLGRLTNLDATVRSNLQSKLNVSVGQFDTALLSYMRMRTGPKFFFDPEEVDDIGSFIKSKGLAYSDVTAHANAVTDSHLFPEQGSSGDYTVSLPGSINWVAPGGSTNPEFIHSMSRMEWWREMVWASGIASDGKYATEVEYELASWSQQFTTAKVPSAWSASDQQGWLLDSSLRAESWSWGYFGFLEHSNFTGAENSLFLYKLAQIGDYLYNNAVSTSDYASNKTIVLGKALLYLGEMFPEIDAAAQWEGTARNLIFQCLETQIYDDGSHVEQSPGYAFNVSNDLLDARQLDQVNGVAWPKDKRLKLANIIDSYWQSLSPNGKRPAIGDSYRNNSLALFTKPDLILGTNRWPAAKPAARDVFIAGVDAVTPYLSSPTTPTGLGARGKTWAMPDSGNYVMRSGDDKQATQINFDAGPKGGSHGHLDLLSFELSGFGRPLISDPGAYKYDKSADRAYVISTAAHNTINVDGLNTAAIEGSGNPDITVSQWKTGSNFAQITATHKGYKSVSGSPTLTRSLWYNLDDTIVIVDWAKATTKHTYQQSYNLQTEGDTKNVVFAESELSARTKYASGGNVKIQGVRTDPGQTASKNALTFVTNTVSGDYKDDAYRFTIQQSGKFVVMVTLITAYNSTTPPDTSARLLNTPVEGGTIQVELTRGGKKQTIDFSQSGTPGLDANGTTRGTYNDIAFDSSNRLHYIYADRDTGELMYALRDAAGAWSAPSVIDSAVGDPASGGYQYISLAIDATGAPSVAYFDGWNGDLRFASRNSTSGKWSGVVVDSKGSTGLYPSLAFARDNAPTISFYNRGTKDLMLATSKSGVFSIKSVDTAGDVGRFSSLQLDPNSPSVTRWAVGYEDTANGNYKYAIQGDSGFVAYTVDDLPDAGGYVSLAFYRDGKKVYQPGMSYYDASESGLRYAGSRDRGKTWTAEYVATKSIQGLYTSIFFDSVGQPNIFYFDRTNNLAKRAIKQGTTWSVTNLVTGGREMHLAIDSTAKIFYSTLDESAGELTVRKA